MKYKVINSESMSWLQKQPDNTYDSIVSDPPYLIDFMGKKWDSEDSVAGSKDFWKEALRVLKPGGHIAVFSHSRTYHRVASAIEDAGFIIRDQIMYVYGSGFPKSHCINKAYGKKSYKETKHKVRQVLKTYLQETKLVGEEQREILLTLLSKQGLSFPEHSASNVWSGQPSLEGWEENKTLSELQECLCSLSRAFEGDGTKGWLHLGAPYGDGTLHWQTSDEEGGGTSHRPQPFKQLYQQLDAIFNEWRAQEVGGSEPIQDRYSGIGTALKPAHEPIVLAMKPLSEKTFVDNVIKWGTGAINIDECRVETQDNLNGGAYSNSGRPTGPFAGMTGQGKASGTFGEYKQPEGRFPANFIHDGSDEVVGMFPDVKTGSIKKGQVNRDETIGDSFLGQGHGGFATRSQASSEGSAARFFYTAKVSKKERNIGCDDLPDKTTAIQPVGDKNLYNPPTMEPKKNNHPTVKPVSLMAYLCKLITPKGGKVLDLFNGSGSTGMAAVQEGFDYTGIEMNPEYCEISKHRIDGWYDYITSTNQVKKTNQLTIEDEIINK